MEKFENLSIQARKKIINNLKKSGGFACAIAHALLRAESGKQATRLMAAFPELMAAGQDEIFASAKEIACKHYLSGTGYFESFVEVFDEMMSADEGDNDFLDRNNLITWGRFEDEEFEELRWMIDNMATEISEAINLAQKERTTTIHIVED